MKLIIDEENSDFLKYNTENIVRMLIPGEPIVFADSPFGDDDFVLVRKQARSPSCSRIIVSVKYREYYKTFLCSIDECDREKHRRLCKTYVARSVYILLGRAANRKLRFGILTGVRPLQVITQAIADGILENDIYFLLRDKYLVDEEKSRLMLEVYKSQREILSMSSDDIFSLYVSIPFCKTRCRYCSFISQNVEGALKLLEPYVDCLISELELKGKYAREKGLKLKSIYVGGGTPTSLETGLLRRVFESIEANFSFENLMEYTVEAGRPDTITEKKLRLFSSFGIGRISINPQTFNDNILSEIGRTHTGKDVIDCYNLARRIGGFDINMDLIAGFESDTIESFSKTAESVLDLRPENITVHSLSKKRSSGINTQGEDGLFSYENKSIHSMLDLCHIEFGKNGYFPYYLYKQKNTVGNCENVGYALSNKASIYNILMMGECHSILGAGAGASGKFVDLSTNYITREYNPKYPFEYIARCQGNGRKKGEILEH